MISMTDSFFLSGKFNDPLYMKLRDLSDVLSEHERSLLCPARDFVEELWQEYKSLSLADKHFLEDAKKHFIQRFWEMYLAVTLRKRGIKPVRVSGKGPEFYFIHESKRVWVEAVAPGPGNGPDAVQTQDVRVPQEKILLRYTNALAEKLLKYKWAVGKGIVKPEDHYVVAVNCSLIPHARIHGELPFVLMAYLAIGYPEIALNRNTKKILDSYNLYRDKVIKKSGCSVSTDSLLNPEYEGITGVLYSEVDPTRCPPNMGRDFCFLHNPLARQFFKQSPFQFCRQYWYKDRTIERKEPDQSA
jgi:hypothetical protein